MRAIPYLVLLLVAGIALGAVTLGVGALVGSQGVQVAGIWILGGTPVVGLIAIGVWIVRLLAAKN